LSTFGEGISETFMFPYNSKVWTTPLEKMSKSWIAERVSVVDFKRLLENVISTSATMWLGGRTTSSASRCMAGPAKSTGAWPPISLTRSNRQAIGRSRYGAAQSLFADGTGDNYDVLISTAPIDLLPGMLKPARHRLREAAALLEHNDLLVLGIGLKKKIDTGKCWVYFTDPEMPCYRATFFSHYSPNNVPNGDTEQYSSLMCEMSVPLGQTVDTERTYEQMLAG
jgi:protoporphyrinogen oxidase